MMLQHAQVVLKVTVIDGVMEIANGIGELVLVKKNDHQHQVRNIIIELFKHL